MDRMIGGQTRMKTYYLPATPLVGGNNFLVTFRDGAKLKAPVLLKLRTMYCLEEMNAPLENGCWKSSTPAQQVYLIEFY